MVNSWNPWFIRGGNHNNGASAGVFNFNNTNGNANGNISFRVVLRLQSKSFHFVESIQIREKEELVRDEFPSFKCYQHFFLFCFFQKIPKIDF